MNYENTGIGKSRFIVVSTQSIEFNIVLLFIVLFSIQKNVDIHLPHPVLFKASLIPSEPNFLDCLTQKRALFVF